MSRDKQEKYNRIKTPNQVFALNTTTFDGRSSDSNHSINYSFNKSFVKTNSHFINRSYNILLTS